MSGLHCWMSESEWLRQQHAGVWPPDLTWREPRTCMLPNGHAGPHEWTHDSDILHASVFPDHVRRPANAGGEAVSTLPEIKARLEAVARSHTPLCLDSGASRCDCNVDALRSILSEWPTLTEEDASLIAECRAYCTGIEGLWPGRLLAILDKHFPPEEKT